MAFQLDGVDRNILAAMQEDASRSLDEIAAMAGASRTAVWHRIKKLRANGIIRQHTVLLDPQKLDLGACFFVLVQTSEHRKGWQEQFLNTLKERPRSDGGPSSRRRYRLYPEGPTAEREGL